ncbi:calcium-binding protein [Oryzicola mucosus]|uniref:Calcium-binding protein n=1 Tax=Oryzicola mucosus TaxID=2767425 RepID=A0A8J6PFQ4_9HYPH|nr:calcium-binding protein [Oryzicola mucosus]MBD0413133.1 calcium-binding protein [Oryzicola mucosus]
MATFSVTKPVTLDSNQLFVTSLNDVTNLRFENQISASGNPLLGEYVQTFETLSFDYNGITYSYNGEWTQTENRLLVLGSVSITGSYDNIELSQGGETIATYQGREFDVDFGTSPSVQVGDLTGNLLQLLVTLGLANGGNGGYDNLTTNETPNLPDLAFFGNDSLTGDAGVQTLRGSDGNDVINGGAGADIMIGGKGNDTYHVDSAGDKVVEIDGQGTDTVITTASYSFKGVYAENLTLAGSSDINGTGNKFNNIILGNSGNNIIDGAAGADKMSGGLGNDTYYVDNIGDKAVEKQGQGNDTVFSSVSYTLKGQYVEDLILTGSDIINATGNKLNNTIVGNFKGNIIKGGDGNDTLTGGNGGDRFVFDTPLRPSNVDTITDFYERQDSIRLDDAVFVGLTEGALIAKAQFKDIGTGTVDASDRILYDSTTGDLFFDRDGSGTAYDAVKFAVIDNLEPLSYRDFLVI